MIYIKLDNAYWASFQALFLSIGQPQPIQVCVMAQQGPNHETVSEEVLAALMAAGSVRAVWAIESSNGRFTLTVQVGQTEKTLRSRRKSIRMFADLNRLNKFCRKRLGINRFEVIGQK